MHGSTSNEDWGQDEVYAEIQFRWSPGNYYPDERHKTAIVGLLLRPA